MRALGALELGADSEVVGKPRPGLVLVHLRGFRVNASQVHKDKPWSRLSDHLAVSAELERA